MELDRSTVGKHISPSLTDQARSSPHQSGRKYRKALKAPAVLTIGEQGTTPGEDRKVLSPPLPEQGDRMGQSCPALNVLMCKEEQGVLLVWTGTHTLFHPTTSMLCPGKYVCSLKFLALTVLLAFMLCQGACSVLGDSCHVPLALRHEAKGTQR